MPLVSMVLILIIVAVLLGLFNWVARQYPQFLDAKIVKIINVVVIVAVVLWVVSVFFGGFGTLGQIRVG
jgi:hypothetical protein